MTKLPSSLPILIALVGGQAWAEVLPAARSAEPNRAGTVEFRPAADESKLAEQFQLAASQFPFEQKSVETSSKAFRISEVTFPSPVTTPDANNNTVHCEYFQPLSAGKHPGVIVLHILGGDFALSRLFCRSLAQNGTAALFLKMPYYGPRRQPDSPARMVSIDPEQTVRGMTQAVLDIRRGGAWLAAQEEVDPERLGIMGISLGGITSALAATAEPRFKNVCLILAGGDVGQVAWESPELGKLRQYWTTHGGTKESLSELLSKVDPVTYSAQMHGRRILMLNARFDEVIPPSCTKSLWKAFGEPEIVWWDAGHYSAARYLLDGLSKATHFFCDAAPPAEANAPTGRAKSTSAE
jgi:dienelactone hydrolase